MLLKIIGVIAAIALSIGASSPSTNKKAVPSKTSDVTRPTMPAVDTASIRNSAVSGQSMGDAKPTLRNPDAFLLALRQKGFQATIDKTTPNAPTIAVGVSGEQIVVTFSGCDARGCSYVQLLDWFEGLTRVQANAVMAYSFKTETYSHPTWIEESNMLACYNYIVIGTDGITVQTLIDNMNYFVETNKEIVEAAFDDKSK